MRLFRGHQDREVSGSPGICGLFSVTLIQCGSLEEIDARRKSKMKGGRETMMMPVIWTENVHLKYSRRESGKEPGMAGQGRGLWLPHSTHSEGQSKGHQGMGIVKTTAAVTISIPPRK